jgi:hypothetical protein
MVTAVRDVPARGSARLLVSFQPRSQEEFHEPLVLRSAKQVLRVMCKGKGVAPEVSST